MNKCYKCNTQMNMKYQKEILSPNRNTKIPNTKRTIKYQKEQ